MSVFDAFFTAHAQPIIDSEFGVLVTLNRGGIASAEFTARKSLRTYEALGAELGIDFKTELRTWLCPIADCVIGETDTKPQVGFTIVEVATNETWKILAPSDGVPAVEVQNDDYICHCQRI